MYNSVQNKHNLYIIKPMKVQNMYIDENMMVRINININMHISKKININTNINFSIKYKYFPTLNNKLEDKQFSNISYSTCKGWKKSRKRSLCEQFREKIRRYRISATLPFSLYYLFFRYK